LLKERKKEKKKEKKKERKKERKKLKDLFFIQSLTHFKEKSKTKRNLNQPLTKKSLKTTAQTSVKENQLSTKNFKPSTTATK
jgi:hypothetical protein